MNIFALSTVAVKTSMRYHRTPHTIAPALKYGSFLSPGRTRGWVGGSSGREASISVLCLCKEWQRGIRRAEESGNVGLAWEKNRLICGMVCVLGIYTG